MQIVINVNTRFAKKLAMIGVAFFTLAIGTVPVIVWAKNYTVPHSFKNGDVADADQVNANFEALQTGINEQEGMYLGLSVKTDANEAMVLAAKEAVDKINEKLNKFDALYVNEGQPNSITSNMIVDGSISEPKLSFKPPTIVDLANQKTELLASLTALSSEVDLLNGRMASAEELVSSMQGEIAGLKNNLADLPGIVVLYATRFDAAFLKEDQLAGDYIAKTDARNNSVVIGGEIGENGISFHTPSSGIIIMKLRCIPDGSSSALRYTFGQAYIDSVVATLSDFNSCQPDLCSNKPVEFDLISEDMDGGDHLLRFYRQVPLEYVNSSNGYSCGFDVFELIVQFIPLK